LILLGRVLVRPNVRPSRNDKMPQSSFVGSTTSRPKKSKRIWPQATDGTSKLVTYVWWYHPFFTNPLFRLRPCGHHAFGRL